MWAWRICAVSWSAPRHVVVRQRFGAGPAVCHSDAEEVIAHLEFTIEGSSHPHGVGSRWYPEVRGGRPAPSSPTDGFFLRALGWGLERAPLRNDGC